jgi:hypothetical protein
LAESPDTQTTSGDAERARFRLRTAGYCVACNRMIEREVAGECPMGHPEEQVHGRVPLFDGAKPPLLPTFNWAAFFLPPIWGPAHGQWAGFFFLPIWLFVDSVLTTVSRGPLAVGGAVVVVAGTLAFQLVFARRANGMAWARVCDRVSVEQFLRAQRRWAWMCVPGGIALLGWAVYYRLVLA